MLFTACQTLSIPTSIQGFWLTLTPTDRLQRWRCKWQPSPVFLPGKSHGQRSLVDYSPGDHKSHRTYQLNHHHPTKSVFAGGSEDKASACHAGDPGLISGLGRSPEEVNGNPLQYSCLENPMDRGAWQATVHGVEKSQTWLGKLF